VLLSTGERETRSADAEIAAPALQAQLRRLELLIVGVGTTAGSLLMDAAGEPLLDACGNPRLSRLNQKLLQDLATEADGRYVAAADRGAVEEALADIIADARGSSSRNSPEESREGPEVFQWMLLAAALLLAWSLCCEFSGREIVALRWRFSAKRARSPLSVLLLALTAALSEQGRAQTPGAAELHPGDPFLEARAQIQRLAAKARPGAADYLSFAEIVAEYALFHRGHAHPVIDSLLEDGFIAIEQGRALDADNPAWDRLQARLQRLAMRAPATRPPNPDPGDPANERADADVLMDVASDSASPEPPGDPSVDADSREVGGGQADVYDQQELTNPTLLLPLHQLQRIRERATAADLFLARQENERGRQDAPAAAFNAEQ
jgi:hypothetical protein